jgi:predicted TIM-barrel fold metal-dependent hydrolase
MMRLIHGGVLDAYPRLKIILGHLGEGLPFLLQRIDFAYTRLRRPDLKKKPSEYLRENMFVATSGNYLPAAFVCTLEALGVDRIVLGTDYPYEDAGECLQFLERMPLTQAEREKIYHQNAGRLALHRSPCIPGKSPDRREWGASRSR